MTGALAELLADGGPVMVPIAACALALWFALGWRALTLRRGDRRRALAALVAEYLDDPRRPAAGIVGLGASIAAAIIGAGGARRAERLAERLGPLEDRIGRGRVIAASLVAAAPLLGLLGTVGGMIETFDSLARMALFARSGGIAGGIAQALITTQAGLAVAIPGLVVARLLERRQARLQSELDELKALAGAWRTA